MGFLEVGTPLQWQDSAEYHAILAHVREHGVEQFIRVWEAVKERKNDELLWGDEIEYHLFRREAPGRYVVSARAAEVLAKLVAEDAMVPEKDRNATWHPEYGSWMVEATPSRPYGGFVADLRRVEPSMRHRRFRVQKALSEMGDYGIVSMVAWPMLGTPDFWEPRAKPVAEDNASSHSLFFPDACINPHPRFPTLTGNILRRRGRKVVVHAPLYRDVNTAASAVSTQTYTTPSADLKHTEQQGEIYMDAMGFGMGNCCLQVTFQARDLDESRYLYDQLAILCPIFLALTAGTPILKGLLADTDARWNIIAQSVDCRTPVELGEADVPITLPGASAPQRSHGRIRKSRYDSVDLFMSTHPTFREEYNDVKSEINTPAFDRLVAAGVDARLARHVAHLWIRDPLVVFSDRVEVDDATTTEHFENLQSTNWQTMRWKPPPLNSSMGWRVEFRPMEVQFSDFENAAFTVVVMLCARVILFFDLSMYIPLSKVDENMERAQKRDAVRKERFFFRKEVVPLGKQCGDVNGPIPASSVDLGGSASSSSTTASNGGATSNGASRNGDSSSGGSSSRRASVESEYEEMTVEEIMLGRGNDFPGLIPLIWAYLDVIQIDADARAVVEDYIDLVVRRAKGQLPTPAQWMREFVAKHPDYKGDSVVSAKVASDLVDAIVGIGLGERDAPSLLGKHKVCKLVEPMEIDRLETRLRTVPGKALRGSSFHTQVGTTASSTFQCAIVRALVEKYRKGNVPDDGSQTLQESVVSVGHGFQDAQPLFKRFKSQA